MKKGTKPLMVPLRREDRGVKDDPQFSPYLPGERYIVFHDYGHPDELGDRGFRTKREAWAWVDAERAKHKPGDPLTNVLGNRETCDGQRHHYADGRAAGECLAVVNFSAEHDTRDLWRKADGKKRGLLIGEAGFRYSGASLESKEWDTIPSWAKSALVSDLINRRKLGLPN